jgi:hypothetical protein
MRTWGTCQCNGFPVASQGAFLPESGREHVGAAVDCDCAGNVG